LVDNTTLQRSVALYRSEFMFTFCRLCATSATFINVNHCMLRSNWPSSTVPVVVLKEFDVLLFSRSRLGLISYILIMLHFIKIKFKKSSNITHHI
jgi:hypothetical protein